MAKKAKIIGDESDSEKRQILKSSDKKKTKNKKEESDSDDETSSMHERTQNKKKITTSTKNKINKKSDIKKTNKKSDKNKSDKKKSKKDQIENDDDEDNMQEELEDLVLPGQRHPTPPMGDASRAFYESLLEQKADSAMALKWCIEYGCLDSDRAAKGLDKLESLKKKQKNIKSK